MNRGVPIVLLILGIMIVGCIGKEDPPIDTDNDLVPDHDDLDDDNDCIEDEWEIQYGLDPLDPNDKYQDLDGDGVDNKNEYDTSTDPTDPNDYSLEMKENITRYGIPLYVNASFLWNLLNETDFDDDGITNDLEITLLMDPVDPSDAWKDYNGDGKSNKVQIMDEQTDPFSS